MASVKHILHREEIQGAGVMKENYGPDVPNPREFPRARSLTSAGLQAPRERVSSIHGKLQLWSSPGCGTEIEIRIPGRTAYQAPSTRSRWYLRLFVPAR
jgi:hypothetical protein